MNFLGFALCGMLSGILGGMGMGGGTLLIPLLTMLFGFNQKVAQAINLISFSTMAIFVVIYYIKSRLINIKVAASFALIAFFTSFLGALFVSVVDVGILKVMFGYLLISISLYEAIQEILLRLKKNNPK